MMRVRFVRLGKGPSINRTINNMAKRFRRSSAALRLLEDDVYGARKGSKWRVNPYPELTDLQIKFLREMMKDNGSKRVARWIGMDETTLLRAAAELGYRMTPDTMSKLRAFFAEADLASVNRDIAEGRDSPTKRGSKYGKGKAD